MGGTDKIDCRAFGAFVSGIKSSYKGLSGKISKPDISKLVAIGHF